MSEVIFTTPHGSHLYGLAHENSDRDLFIVTNGADRMHQHTDGETDVTRVGIYTLLRYAMEGSHQSAEAIFSQEKDWNLNLKHQWLPLVNAVRIGGPVVMRKYRRTVVKFAFGDFKRRRHACRLYWNAQEMAASYRFNPTMTRGQVILSNYLAEHYEGQDLLDQLGVQA